jgi:hypothetical protein
VFWDVSVSVLSGVRDIRFYLRINYLDIKPPEMSSNDDGSPGARTLYRIDSLSKTMHYRNGTSFA